MTPFSDDARVFVVRTTSRCNMACSYCYVHDRLDATIDFATVERLIAQSAELEENTIVFVWHGGEPLLMGQQFFQAVVDCENRFPKRFINAVQTNGLALNDRYVDFFAENAFRIAVSLDLPRGRHDQNRRRKNGASGTFDQIANNLDRLARRGLPVAVLAVVTDLDLPIEDYLDVIDGYRLDSLALNVEFDLGRTASAVSAERFSRVLRGLYDHAAGTDRLFALREAEAVIEHLRRSPVGYCWHTLRFCGETHNAIAENGDIYACCDKFIEGAWTDAKLGNIRTERLADIFASDRFKDLMRTLAAARSACTAHCAIGGFCKGGCVHDALTSRQTGATPDKRRHEVGCVARTALFRHIEHDFLTTASA